MNFTLAPATRTAQRLGFSLDEIGQLLELEDGTRLCAHNRNVSCPLISALHCC